MTTTHLTNSFNAVPNCRWMHVCPFGEHVWNSADGNECIVQVIDTEACLRMAESYPLSIPNSRIDIDHESMESDKRTAAVGWGKRAEVRDDGLWVEVEWNPDGHELIANRVYKFNSPCFPRDGLVDLGNGRMRVTKLGVIALTNDPNLRGQKPLTNRRAQVALTNTTNNMDYKAELLKLLGLPPEATDEQVATACSAGVENKKTCANRITELEEMIANRDLDEHGIIDSEQRKLLVPSLTNKATRPAALAILAKGKAGAAPVQQPLHNRSNPHTPNTAQQLKQPDDDRQAAAEKQKAEWIGNRARELRLKTPGMRHQDSFAQAETEFSIANK